MPQLNIGEELVLAGEDDVVQELVTLQVAIMRSTVPIKRGQHAKHHGCVVAEFLVRGDIPQVYKVGLFAEPKSYQAVVRWSNGASADDTTPDVHGMAVKVLDVKGLKALSGDSREEHDFVLVDSELFFAPDAKTLLAFMKARVASATTPAVMQEFARNNPRTMALFAAGLTKISSPLTAHYWSTVPFKFGNGAVKYVAIPAPGNGSGNTEPTSADCLRTAMIKHLTEKNESAMFDLCIIPQTDVSTTPIEDPTVRWESAPVPVARIRVGPQDFATRERLDHCEATSFDPWNALVEHRPLGGINRARRAVYPESVRVRRSGLDDVAPSTSNDTHSPPLN